MRLIRVLLYVKDLPRMIQFYSAILGSEPSYAEDQYVDFESGRLALHAIPGEIADHSTTPHPRETTPIRLTFLADDLSNATSRGNIFEIAVQEPRPLS